MDTRALFLLEEGRRWIKLVFELVVLQIFQCLYFYVYMWHIICCGRGRLQVSSVHAEPKPS